MKYHIEVKKTLETDNEKKFFVGSEIAFTVKDTGKHYIAEIIEICDTFMVVDNIDCGKEHLPGKMVVYYDNIVDNSCSYVSVD